MASWIVHLRIADKLLDEIPGLDAAQFAIGNVAPDSGVPDENWETFDPPPEVTHFQQKEKKGVIRQLEDLRFYRQYMAGKVTLESEPKRFSFLLGYFFHLITDNLWSQRIVLPTHKTYADQFEGKPDFIWEVKKDWYGLDFSYVRSHPDSLFWGAFLNADYTEVYLEHFPPQAIPDKLQYIKDFYRRMDDEVEKSLRLKNNQYLNEAEMALFVDGAYRDLARIYSMLWERETDLGEMTSAVELLG